MSSKNRLLVPRQVLRSGLICGAVFMSGVGFLTDKGVSADRDRKRYESGYKYFNRCPALEQKYRLYKSFIYACGCWKPNRGNDLYPRNAGLEVTDAVVIAAALHEAPLYGGIDLRSFSISCSPGLTDDGVIALAKVLLHTLTELSFVKCAIRDDGGAALLKSGYKANRLRMICAEGENFYKAIKAKFAMLAQEKSDLLVIV